MPTATTRRERLAFTASTLLLAFDLGNRQWMLAFTTGGAQQPRTRTMPARDLARLDQEIADARTRFGLPANAPVIACYEAGRDGFWLARALEARGIATVVVDSASIETNRRARQAKSDRLDAQALVTLLERYLTTRPGQRPVWRVVSVPSVAEEDRRHLHREIWTLTRERTRMINRIKGLLASQGVRLETLRRLPATLPVIQLWDGSALPPGIHARIAHEWDRLRALQRLLVARTAERRALLKTATDPAYAVVRQLYALRGVGEVSAWLTGLELFTWRALRNRREVAALVGLTPTTRKSGGLVRELGISRAGNRYLRSIAIELAWSWLRYQPGSALSLWYHARFGAAGSRPRRIGIVALARKLLIALWRYVETGIVPTGAALKTARA